MELVVFFLTASHPFFFCMKKQNFSPCKFILANFNFPLDMVSAFSANFRGGKVKGNLTTVSAHHST